MPRRWWFWQREHDEQAGGQPPSLPQPEPVLQLIEGSDLVVDDAQVSIPMPAPAQDEHGSEPRDTDETYHRRHAAEPVEPDTEPREARPYTTSEEHLIDELRRIDELVHAQFVRWEESIASRQEPRDWGMITLSEDEFAAYLASEFKWPPAYPPAAEWEIAAYQRRSEAVAREIEARKNLTDPSVVLRLERFRERFDLSDDECDTVLLCLIAEIDQRYRRLFGYLQNDASRSQPTVELILQILQSDTSRPGAGRDMFDSQGRLLANRLMVVGAPQHADEPLPNRSARIDDRISAYLLGNANPGDWLPDVLEWPALEHRELFLAPQIIQSVQRQAEWWERRREREPRGMVLLLHGPDGAGHEAAAEAICVAAGIPLLTIDARQRRTAGDWDDLVAIVYREATLADAAVYWQHCETLIEPDGLPSEPAAAWNVLVQAAGRFTGLTFFESEVGWDPDQQLANATFRRLSLPMPDYEMRRRIWQNRLDATPEAANFANRAALAEELANGFQLTEEQIDRALTTAIRDSELRDPGHPRLLRDDVFEGCRRASSRRLDALAQRVEPRTELTFDDLILPKANKRQLEELQQRIRLHHRVHAGRQFDRRLMLGKGLVVLFTGGPGTGKTMAAELLGLSSKRDLYKVDMSLIVSKWVGETEKNLSRLFSDAANANALIFFDEADTMFGKRGEVKEAQDRWANMEVNYLLQRIEEYAGIVILASNLRQNIDEAFLRRIHVIVEFPFPDGPGRLRILQSLFPPDVTRPDEHELRAFAENFKLPGGSFRNVVIDAAFRAEAAAGVDPCNLEPVITLRHLVAATAREYQKLGKPITRGEFTQPYYDWVTHDIFLDQ